MQVWHFPGQKLRLGGDSLGADPTYLLHLPYRSRGELRRIDFGAWPHTATLRLKLSPKSTLEAWSVGLAGSRVRESTSVVRVSRGDFCASTWPSYSNQALHAYASRRTRGASAFRPTHTICRSSPSAPLRGSPPPEDNEQATKAAEHGEQRGDGVDAVDPGDLARGGEAANHLNTRHNSQSKCGARRNARLSSRGAQGQRRAPAQPAWACSGPHPQLGAGGTRTAPSPRAASEVVGREGPPPPTSATYAAHSRPQARRSKVRPRCDWPGSARLELVGAIEQPHVCVKAPGSTLDTAQPLLAL